MATIQERPFAKSYSGLVSQTIIAAVIFGIGVTSFEIMKRKRRGKEGRRAKEGMGSVETWGFGYLYNGRTWSTNPSPPSASHWPIVSWVKQALTLSEEEFFRLRGVDATTYIRILKGCLLFCAIQTCTTFAILMPIHIVFSQGSGYARSSLLRASVSFLAYGPGARFFPIHVVLSYWIFISWTGTVLWVARGLFYYRAESIQQQVVPSSDQQKFNEAQSVPNKGLRWRTVMVTNIPPSLRSERALQEYFEYFMSRPMAKPITPTIMGKALSVFYKKAKHKAVQILPVKASKLAESEFTPPMLERVVVVRKLTELSSLLRRREDILRKLELAHLKLAKKALQAVKLKSERHPPGPLLSHKRGAHGSAFDDLERRAPSEDEEQLIRALEPYVDAYEVPCPDKVGHFLASVRTSGSTKPANFPPLSTAPEPEASLWETLYDLPRHVLDPYQPLIRLKALFRGSTVPAIDYYTTKLGFLTNIIEEKRSQPLEKSIPASTAFVTFADPMDAVKACTFLPCHPDNPVQCLTVPAPDVADLDWERVMKSAFSGEFIRDWVVSIGVWSFTILWIIPVSLFVSLVNITNIAAFIPVLAKFLDNHSVTKNILQNFLPTFLVSVLAILIPLVLLLIAKKANLILTYSALHNSIMIRYHKFLVCNLLVFFCFGVTALESILTGIKNEGSILSLIAEAYPTAGPFYVGWLIFTTGIHAGLEIGLLGLPLMVYPATRRTPLPRKRALGIRPRTLNYYYWLPNHVFVMFLVTVFAVLNPLVIPFTMIYFAVETVVIKNQLLHVYARPYEGNGRNLLIRFTRYTMDGLMLAEVVLFAFLLLNKKVPHAVFTALLLGVNIGTKLYVTRLFTRKFEEADILEAEVACGIRRQKSKQIHHSPLQEEREPEGTYNARIDTLRNIFSSERAKFWSRKPPFTYVYKFYMGRQQRDLPKRTTLLSDEEKDEVFTRPQTVVETSANTSDTVPPAPVNGENEVGNAEAAGNDAAVAEGADFTGASGPTVYPTPTTSAIEARKQGKVVTSHEPHPNWDDTPRYDLTYDNPFYTRLVQNFLWLPRNPFGTLDLDDTVDLHRAITCEPSPDTIGKWLSEGNPAQGLINADFNKPSSPSDDGKIPDYQVRSGRESIILPEGIASRIDVDDDIEEATERPISWMERRRSSSRSVRRPKLQMRNSTKSFSSTRSGPLPDIDGSPVDRFTRMGKMRSASASEAENVPSTFRAHLRPVSPGGSRFTGSSDESANLSRLSRGSRQSLRPQSSSIPLGMIRESSGLPKGAAVSAQEAVVEEVLAEEEIEEKERAKEEREELIKEEKKKTHWLTSWMYKSHQGRT